MGRRWPDKVRLRSMLQVMAVWLVVLTAMMLPIALYRLGYLATVAATD